MTPSRSKVAIVLPTIGLPSEIWAYRQACALAARFEISIVVWDRLGSEIDVAYDRFPVHEVGLPWQYPRTIGRRIRRRLSMETLFPTRIERREALELRKIVESIEPDLLLCHYAWTGKRLPSPVYDSIPVIWHLHGRDAGPQLRDSVLYRRAFRRHGRRASAMVAVGHAQASRIRKAIGAAEPRVHVVPCGVPLNIFQPCDRSDRPSDAPVLLQVGRLSPEKGVFETVEAFARMAGDNPGASLRFVGDGPLKSELETYIQQRGVMDRASILGAMDSAEVAACMRDADVLIQNSIPTADSIEGFGVTVAEGGSTGLPIIATAVGGLLDQVEHRRNGLLVDPGDVNALSEAMSELGSDVKLRRELGAVASDMAARFDADLMVSRLSDLIQDTIHRVCHA